MGKKFPSTLLARCWACRQIICRRGAAARYFAWRWCAAAETRLPEAIS